MIYTRACIRLRLRRSRECVVDNNNILYTYAICIWYSVRHGSADARARINKNPQRLFAHGQRPAFKFPRVINNNIDDGAGCDGTIRVGSSYSERARAFMAYPPSRVCLFRFTRREPRVHSLYKSPIVADRLSRPEKRFKKDVHRNKTNKNTQRNLAN